MKGFTQRANLKKHEMVHTGKYIFIKTSSIVLPTNQQFFHTCPIYRRTPARLPHLQKGIHPIRKHEKTHARSYEIETIGVSKFKQKKNHNIYIHISAIVQFYNFYIRLVPPSINCIKFNMLSIFSIPHSFQGLSMREM